MVKRKVDNRIRVLIENGVALGHRTMVVVVGDKSRDQVKYCAVLRDYHYLTQPFGYTTPPLLSVYLCKLYQFCNVSKKLSIYFS